MLRRDRKCVCAQVSMWVSGDREEILEVYRSLEIHICCPRPSVCGGGGVCGCVCGCMCVIMSGKERQNEKKRQRGKERGRERKRERESEGVREGGREEMIKDWP